MAEPKDKLGKDNKLRKLFAFLKWLLVKLFSSIKWLLWDFSGLRFAWEKIRPPVDQTLDRRPPSTFLLWASGIFGIYVAFFSVASQRYENTVDKIENRANAICTQLATPAYKMALSRIPGVQHMLCPCKPQILKPSSVFHSLFSKDTEYIEMVELMTETIENRKDSLDSVNLREADLQKADLRGAILEGADLRKAEDLTIEQLCKAKTLYGAKLDPELMEQIKEKYPHLLEEPKPSK